MSVRPETGFLSPFEVDTPAGADGWQEMYPYYARFGEARRASEEGRFWFFDGMHNPEPIFPFDTIMTENWWVACNQMTTRVFLVPPAWGIDHRIVNGYLYISPSTLSDPDVIARRAEHFARRAGHYFEHWDEIYAAWVEKAEDCIERLRALEFRPLPEVEDEAMVTGHRGVYSGYDLLTTYDRLIENLFEMGSYHFEMLNLGYGAYLTFREFCQGAFPGITDQTVARMVAGIDILLFRPDDEVRKLAALAVELGVADAIRDHDEPAAALAEIGRRERGGEWLAALEAAKEPWFWYSTGAGYTHTDRAWADDLRLPFNSMRGYVEKLEAGEPVDRPLERILGDRGRITAEYRELLPTDEDRVAFDELVQLARTVYPYVENHNFYVEHWHHSLFFNKVRELGDLFVARGFLEDREDIFYLHRNEIHSALYDLIISWAAGTEGGGPTHWPPIVRRRREIRDALAGWTPPPALGVPPEEISEPITIMLWGITRERVDEWLGAGADADGAGALRGVAASPGKARGPARVVTSAEDLHQVRSGEILVCRVTAPSWAPVFNRIAAAVSDVGGIMAHTAIVSREYGLPAVVGTGFATQRVRTGQLIEVDGDEGVVRVLDAGPA
jgi:pyruvate,water dikinase